MNLFSIIQTHLPRERELQTRHSSFQRSGPAVTSVHCTCVKRVWIISGSRLFYTSIWVTSLWLFSQWAIGSDWVAWTVWTSFVLEFILSRFNAAFFGCSFCKAPIKHLSHSQVTLKFCNTLSVTLKFNFVVCVLHYLYVGLLCCVLDWCFWQVTDFMLNRYCSEIVLLGVIFLSPYLYLSVNHKTS